MQFRIVRYKASLVCETADEFFDQELKWEEDPQLSVYRISAHETEAMHLEHKAGALVGPPGNEYAVDVESLGVCDRQTPAEPASVFSRRERSHYVLSLTGRGSLREFSDRLFGGITQRSVAPMLSSKHQLREHLRGLVAANDHEWAAFLQTAPSAWKKFAGCK